MGEPSRSLSRRHLKRHSRKLINFSALFVDKHIFRRTENLRQVQRFVLGWLAVAAIAAILLGLQLGDLKAFYLGPGPRSGGLISEGVVGQITSINPLFPENNATAAANKLIFNGLVRYNGAGQIEGDLAQSWDVDATGKIYTFHLRKDVHWHDGQPFTAKDVLFTFTIVQNRNVNSPLTSSWRNIKVSAPDDYTVVFNLPVPYTPFLDSLTTGILPQHLLANIDPVQLRKVEFNQHPIGTGPFQFRDFSIARDEVRLVANPAYFRGRPRVDSFVLHLYPSPEELVRAYSANQVNLAGGLRSLEVAQIQGLPNTHVQQFPLANQSFVFFNTRGPLLKARRLRQALVQAVPVDKIVARLNNGFLPAHGPLLAGQLGYSPQYEQLAFNQAGAARALDKAGWKRGKTGKRQKHHQQLHFNLVTQNNDVYPTVAAALQDAWSKVGVSLRVNLVGVEELQQNFIKPRRFDMVLTGIAQGLDPDVYPYWHSSQAQDPGLNLSQYRSTAADQALEGGRTRQADELRAAKYRTFMQIWRSDAPALAVFRPNYFYATRSRIMGIEVNLLGSPTDRFYNVEQWTVNTQPVLKRLIKQ